MVRIVSVCLLLALLGSWSMACAETNRAWTVMVFLNGDNNLDAAGIVDINEMERVGSTEDVAIIVQHDREGNEGTKRLHIVKDLTEKIISPVIEDLPEVDMGNWREASAFYEWGAKHYPAKQYLFIFWNHGRGWESKSGKSPLFKGVSYDDTSGNHIRMGELSKAIEAMKAYSGRKLDILAFDACLMQMAEVAACVAPYARYQVAAEEVEPGKGWPYEDILSALVSDPSVDAASLSRMMVEQYVASYKNGSQGTELTNQSAIDLGAFDEFMSGLDALANTLLDNEVHLGSVLDDVEETQVFDKPQYKDLGDFLRHLANGNTVADVRTSAKNLFEFYKKHLVIASGWSGSKLSGSTGLSIWFPTKRQYNRLHKQYASLEFAQNGRWDDFLHRLYNPLKPIIRISKLVNFGVEGSVGPGDEIAIAVQLQNIGGAATSSLNVRMVSKHPFLKVLDKTITIASVPAGEKVAASVQRLRISPQCPVGRELPFYVEVTDGDGQVYRQFKSILVKQPFIAKHSVLLIVLSKEHPHTKHYIKALNDASISFDLWPIDYYGPPNPSILEDYVSGTVMFHASAPGDIYSLGLSSLSTYLDAGGSLFISGQDVGYKLKNKAFFTDYLHGKFVQDNVGCKSIKGAHWLAGFTQNLDAGGSGPNNQGWIDEIDPVGPAVPILSYGNPVPGKGPISSGSAGLAVSTRGFRVVYLAFGLVAVGSDEGRSTLTRLALEYLLEGKAGSSKKITRRKRFAKIHVGF